MKLFLLVSALVVVAKAGVAQDTDVNLLNPDKTKEETKTESVPFQQPPDEIPKDPSVTVPPPPVTVPPPQNEGVQEETSNAEPQPVIPISEPDPSPQLCFDGKPSPILIGLPGPSGPMGPQGYPGLQGSVGLPGNHGVNGVSGLPGYPGERGPKGGKGEPGYTGVDGQPGFEGPIGPRGDAGYPGEQGFKGLKGQKGRPGSAGSPGTSGTTGPSGIPGSKGDLGEPGLQGDKGECLCPDTKSESNKRSKISFSVARSVGVFADNGPMVVKWNHVFNEAGENFNPETGIFNCTVAGSYYFTFHVAKSSNTNFPLVSLMKNGESTVSAIDYGSMDSEDSTSNSLILDLEVDDKVWLELYEGRELYSSHYKFTTFSGWLLFPAN